MYWIDEGRRREIELHLSAKKVSERRTLPAIRHVNHRGQM